MKKDIRGFTLIELLAVIIILGILLIITIPNVTKNIFTSKTASYAYDVDALAKSAMTTALEKGYGTLPLEDEILVIPYNIITLEKNKTLKSPYGSYDLERSYVVIMMGKSSNGNYNGIYQAFVYAYDETGIGIYNIPYKEIVKGNVKEYETNAFITLSSMEELNSIGLNYNSKVYDNCIIRSSEALLCTE